jgi:hypothetical protein
MVAVGLVLILWTSFPITTIGSWNLFGESNLVTEVLSVVFSHLQTGQIKTDPSLVRLKIIRFSQVGQNSITVSSLDRINCGVFVQY